MAVIHLLVENVVNQGTPQAWVNQFTACKAEYRVSPEGNNATLDKTEVTCKRCLNTAQYDPIKYRGRW